MAISQSLNYDIILFGNSIGNGKGAVSKTTSGNLNYKLVTSASAKVILKPIATSCVKWLPADGIT